MAGLNTLNITNPGLININKKIVNSRTYETNLITTIGSPIVNDGIASGMSNDSYFTHSQLNLQGVTNAQITLKGTIILNSQKQCILELLTYNNDPLSLIFEDHKIELTFKENALFSISNLTFINNSDINIVLILKEDSYEFTLNYGNEVIQKTGSTNNLFIPENFTSLALGNSLIDSTMAWYGSINLPEFSIYSDTALIYSPSIGTSWQFTHILVSDGKFHMSDNTPTVAGHVFSFPVTEITRSGNTILLTCTISEDTYLVIRELGLYVQTTEGRRLFGYIENLNVNKEKDLSYNLVFTVNTTLNVVNAVGFPAEEGIIVKDPNFVEFKNFTTIKEVNTYVLTNLERIIRMNAGAKGSYENSAIINNQAGIGHNRAQVIYRIQQELEKDEDCYNTLDTYTKLASKFRKKYEKQLNHDLGVITEGNLTIPPNGNTKEFSTTDFAHAPTPFKSTKQWKVTTAFTTGRGTEGTPISLGNEYGNAPLELTVENNNCHLKIKNTRSINPYVGGYYYNNYKDNQEIGNVYYYAWSKEGTPLSYNFHCSNLAVSNSAIVTFPLSRSISTIHPNLDPEMFTFESRVKFSNLEGIHYVVGSPSASNRYSFEIFADGPILKANLYDGNRGTLITQIAMHFHLRANRYYNIHLSYEDEVYTFRYIMEPEAGEYAEEETHTFASIRTVKLSTENPLILGAQYTTSPRYKLRGEIDLAKTILFDAGIADDPWVGACLLEEVFTTSSNPQNDLVYDPDLYQILSTYVTSTESTYIINEDIFPVENNTHYLVEIEYTEDSTTGIYKVTREAHNNEKTREEVFRVEMPVTANLTHMMDLPTTTYVGVTPSHQNPYSAIVNLLEWVIEQGNEIWPFGRTVTVSNTELLQYYKLPDENKSFYTTGDLCDLGRMIRFLDTKFEGNRDIISFLYEEGITICTKVDLKDSEPKVILYKSDLVDSIYFALTFLNQTLACTVMDTSGNTYSVSKELELNEYDSYTNEPITITIKFTPQYDGWGYLQMFKNNEPITESVYVKTSTISDPSMYILSNYLTSTENFGKYVQDLVIIKGVISDKDLQYINNLFDTNY